MPSKFLLPANEVCEGYVFTGVCLSMGGGGMHGRGRVWQGEGWHAWQGGHAWQGACMARVACMVGGMHGGGVHGRGACMADNMRYSQ